MFDNIPADRPVKPNKTRQPALSPWSHNNRMNYYIDTEFIEDFTAPCISIPSFRTEKPKHYIELISIGIVSEDDREYYAVSKDFDLKHVWDKHDTEWSGILGEEPTKIYWLRENVLRPLHKDLYKNVSGDMKNTDYFYDLSKFSYKSLKRLISIYGKTNKQIAEDIQLFTAGARQVNGFTIMDKAGYYRPQSINQDNPSTFYAYYADYDWVVFCSLFGRMLDLPKGYPMYCRDLKQMLDETVTAQLVEWGKTPAEFDMLNHIKTLPEYPTQQDEHHALADARWDRSLHQFLKSRILAKTTA